MLFRMKVSTADILVYLKYNWTLRKKDAIEKSVKLAVGENAMDTDAPFHEDTEYSELEDLDALDMNETCGFESDFDMAEEG